MSTLTVEIVTPEDHMGDVIGDLNSRRGQVQGMSQRGTNTQIIAAQVPLASMFGYATELRRFCNATTDSLAPMADSTSVTIGGSVEGYLNRITLPVTTRPASAHNHAITSATSDGSAMWWCSWSLATNWRTWSVIHPVSVTGG